MAATLLALSLQQPLRAQTSAAGRFYEDALKRFEARDLDGSIVQLKNALQQDRRFVPAYLLLGRASLGSSNPGAAEAAFDQALQLGASRAEVAPLLAEALLAQGKHKTLIVDERLQAGGLPPGARARLLLVQAAAYTDLGDERGAAQAIEQARQLAPNTPESWLAEATLKLRERNWTKAQAAVERALQLSPNLPDAIYLRGSLAQASGRLGAAARDYDEVLRLQPDHLEALISRAALAADQGRTEAALADIATARKRFPKDPRADYLEALLAERRGDAKTSREALQRIANLIAGVPVEFVRYRPQLLLLAALSNHALGDLDKARPYLETLQRQEPESPATKLLAQVHYAQGDIEKGIALLERYVALQPQDWQAVTLMAAGHARQGRHERATALMNQAVQASDQPGLRGALGQSLLSQGRVDAARAELERVWKRNPQTPGVGEALTLTYLRGGETAKALALTQQLTTQRSNDALAHQLRGQALLANGDRNGARQSFEKALTLSPGLMQAELGLVRLDAAERRYPAAQRRLDRLQRAQPRALEPLMELAALAHAQRNWAQAQQWLERAAEVAPPRDHRPAFALVDLQLQAGQPQRAVEAAKRLLARDPDDLRALVAMARAQLAASEPKGAAQTLVAAGRRAGYEVPALLEVARLQLDAGDPKGALYTLAKVQEEAPDSPAALVLAATAELASGDPGRADERVKRLLQLRPRDALTHLMAAEVAMARQQPEVALAALRRAHEFQPSTATTMRLMLHLARFDTGPGARQVAEAWLKRRPDDLEVLRALAENLSDRRQWADARAAYERLLSRLPDDAPAHNNLALAQLQLGDFVAAQASAERAVKLAPGQGLPLDTLAWVLHRKGQHDKALALLRDARTRAPDNGEIRYHLAAVLAKLGRQTEARNELRELRNNPAGLESVQEAAALLRSLE